MTAIPPRATIGPPQTPSGLLLTGERTLPGIPDENYWFQRHVVAYQQVTALAQGATVLDAGCGEGYGLRMLADAGAKRVVGVDLDGPTVEHAAATHGDDAIEVHRAELMSLPLDDDEIDLTVSFQVIEHLHDIPGYLGSLRRVTRPGGTIVIATPNRLTFTPGSDTPVNPFHTIEFTADELRDELERAGLDVTTMVGVGHGALLAATDHQLQHGPDGTHVDTSFLDVLTTKTPDQWPKWLRDLVHRTKPRWFRVGPDQIDASLDLIATCVNPA